MTRVALALALVLPLSFAAVRSASAVPITVSLDPVQTGLGPAVVFMNPVPAPLNTFDLTDGVLAAQLYGQFTVQSSGPISGGGTMFVGLHSNLTVNGVTQAINMLAQGTFPFGGGPAIASVQASGPYTFDLGSTGMVTVNLLQVGPVPIPAFGGNNSTWMIANFLLTAPTVPTDPSPVPEPTTLLLFASGLAMTIYRRRKS